MNTTTNSNKVIKRSIILCWVALALCFLVKICGGNFFAIAVENERFIAVCEYIDSNCVRLIQFINYTIMSCIYYCATFRVVKPNKRQLGCIALATALSFLIKMLNMYVGAIFEIVLMILLPVVVAKQKWYYSVLYVVIYYLFGYVSLFVKNISNVYLPSYSLLGLIFSLDVYFMLILFMLYNKKEA